ncbi:MAG: branched-chain amino acid ABC transporter permease [Hyphomicrobiales bacterium]|nr:branched-chain amino acid ABC transporter permease [Hyphomicrobiales bacterium]
MTKRSFLVALALAIGFAVVGFESGRFWAYLVYSVAIASIGALSLNILIGYCGQITFAQGALIGVGAYGAGIAGNAGWGAASLLVGAVCSALVSLLIGLPALRLRGLYFAISTLAAQFILNYLFKILQPLTNGVSGLVVKPLMLFGRPANDEQYAVICVGLLFLSWLVLTRIIQTNVGRAFLVVRESELVARGMGVDVARAKIQAFLLSGFFAGLCGGLIAFTSRLANPEAFEIGLSVDQTAMIIVGGLGSLGGSIIGAGFVTLLPEAIERLGELLPSADLISAFREMAFGILIILFLLLEPRGIVALARRIFARRGAAARTNLPDRASYGSGAISAQNGRKA